jgi:hypothetical protein
MVAQEILENNVLLVVQTKTKDTQEYIILFLIQKLILV